MVGGVSFWGGSASEDLRDDDFGWVGETGEVPKRSVSEGFFDGGFGWVGGGVGWASPLWWDPEEVKTSLSEGFRDFLGTTLGDGDAPFPADDTDAKRSLSLSSF